MAFGIGRIVWSKEEGTYHIVIPHEVAFDSTFPLRGEGEVEIEVDLKNYLLIVRPLSIIPVNERPVRCGKCGLWFKSRSELMKHMWTQHIKVRKRGKAKSRKVSNPNTKHQQE